MEKISRNLCFLELLAKPGSKQQAAALLKWASDDQINTISECSLNVLHGGINLTKHYKVMLRKDASVIRQLADKESGSRKRRSVAIKNLETVSRLAGVCVNQLRWLRSM